MITESVTLPGAGQSSGHYQLMHCINETLSVCTEPGADICGALALDEIGEYFHGSRSDPWFERSLLEAQRTLVGTRSVANDSKRTSGVRTTVNSGA